MSWDLVLGVQWVQVAVGRDGLLDCVWVAAWDIVVGFWHLLELLSGLPSEHAPVL